MCYENFDASDGWVPFLESKGITFTLQKLYSRFFVHCALQGLFTPFDSVMRRRLTEGGMNGFTTKLEGYDFLSTYDAVEDAYRGTRRWTPELAPLSNDDARVPFLPDPTIGIANAKYLLEAFVIPQLEDSRIFVDDFKSYSMTVASTVGTVCRAMNQVSKSVKIA